MNQALVQLKEKSVAAGSPLNQEQLALFEQFLIALAAYNEHTNLVSQANPATVIDNHIVDSLSLVPLMAESGGVKAGKAARLIDIGTGAGFPGLMLAIACPDLEVTLVEAVGKKCTFLEEIVINLNLADRVKVLNERSEILAHQKEFRAQFNFATARAVGPTDILAELCLPFLRIGGLLLVQKSQAQLEEEKHRANMALKILGAQLTDCVETNSADRKLVILVIEKTAATDASFPRQFAKIKRHPLGLR